MTFDKEEEAKSLKNGAQRDPENCAVKTTDGAENERGEWGGKLDFLMSALSFAVGMGNLWRFPYLCYRNGGGAFLIPYVVMVILAGVPLIFLEMSIGQYSSLSVVSIWRASPIFQGIGWTMFCISGISCMYYNMLIAYSFFYMFSSFSSDVPWRNCGNWWNTDNCMDQINNVNSINCTAHNGTWLNGTCLTVATHGQDAVSNALNYINSTNLKPVSASDEYFHHYMLRISDGFHDMGAPQWQLFLCLLLCWVLVMLGLSTGVKSLGKATYVTTFFPYVILVILFIRGMTLEGSSAGVLYYLTPKWSSLIDAKVWADAAIQVFFSMSCCWGGLITLASYNKFNNNVLRDSLVIAAGDCLTSIFGGVVIFAIIGYMANVLNVDIDKVATQGAGLAYIVYPQVVTTLPISPLWAILFMLMLVNLGIGTQFTLVTTVHTTILDMFPSKLRKGRRPLLLLGLLCSIGFTIGLIFTTRGGMYALQLFDTYAPSYALLTVGLMECVAVGWVYGEERFTKNLRQMMGPEFHTKFWFICWKFVTPILILAILLFTLIDFKRTTYSDYVFPITADVIGWIVAIVEIACIPGAALYVLVTAGGDGNSLMSKIRTVCRPSKLWGPANEVQDKCKDGQEMKNLMTEGQANVNSDRC